MTSTAEQSETALAPPEGEPKATKKARVSARRAHLAPAKVKAGKKASPAKKVPKARTKAEGAREGTKAAKILDLLKRKDGSTLKELMKTTGWQPHSVRGFLSGTVSKKMGLTVVSTKRDDGERSYSIKA